MIEAFASGGCFHSRTAVGMYPHIQKAIKEEKVLLEWDNSQVNHCIALFVAIVMLLGRSTSSASQGSLW